MSRHTLVGTLVGVLLLFAVAPLRANDGVQQNQNPRIKTISLQWEDLAPLVAGREVEIVLPDGTKLKGAVYAVRPDSLILDVKKTSNKRAYPKGQQFVERASISSLDLRNKTIRWRVIATIAGTLVGFFTGGYVYCMTDSIPLGLTVMAGLPIGLHAAARPVDVQVTRIEIKAPSIATLDAPLEGR